MLRLCKYMWAAAVREWETGKLTLICKQRAKNEGFKVQQARKMSLVMFFGHTILLQNYAIRFTTVYIYSVFCFAYFIS